MQTFAKMSVADTLRDASQGTGVYMGTAMKSPNDHPFSLEYQKYLRTGGEQYESFTAENNCKMSFIAKDWDRLDFDKCDSQF